MNAIRGGLAYIAEQQLSSGGFASYRLHEPGAKRAKRYETTFVASLILLALQDVASTKVLRGKIASFLVKQGETSWTWNYWDRTSTSAKRLPYPDDIDASFVAMAALYRFDKALFTPTRMANMANALFATETKPGGPYRTWLVDDTASEIWRDVDLVVNINVAGFLSLHDVTLENINRAVERAIKTGKLESPYYPSLQPAAYFLARWYVGPSKEKVQNLILAEGELGIWTTPHQTALSVSSLLRLGYPPQKLQSAIEYLIAAQARDGSWPAGPICLDARRQGETELYYTGSASLTTALCVEALALYETVQQKTPKGYTARQSNSQYRLVTQQAQRLVDDLPHRELKLQTHKILTRIITQDRDRQIVMLPWLVARAAEVKTAEPLLHKLAIASLWGWTAYTIYDDFLDNEGDPVLLPSAVFAQRQLLSTFEGILPEDVAFHDEIRQILNRLDQANAWEVTHCRGVIRDGKLFIRKLPDYGDYWQLADRSLGHTIAGMGVFYSAGRDAESRQGLHDFFKQYLIARQLNDDAHDWEDDLRLGHVNAVAVQVLRVWMGKHSLASGIDLTNDLEELQMIMWKEVIDKVCADVSLHIDRAKQAIKVAGMNEAILLPMLEPLEQAANKALVSRDEALEFIAAL